MQSTDSAKCKHVHVLKKPLNTRSYVTVQIINTTSHTSEWIESGKIKQNIKKGNTCSFLNRGVSLSKMKTQ